jgi:uncharacterized protein YdhG (YjbR/CyaY superfamily)
MATRTTQGDGISAEEKAAMQELARESKRSKRGRTTPEEDAAEVLAKIEAMAPADRRLAERIHELVLAAAPDLTPKTWYGMPAYFKNGRSICFFQDAAKFKVRYATLGFQPDARLDDGDMWPIAYAVIALTPAVEARITELVRAATT